MENINTATRLLENTLGPLFKHAVQVEQTFRFHE